MATAHPRSGIAAAAALLLATLLWLASSAAFGWVIDSLMALAANGLAETDLDTFGRPRF